MNPKNKTFEDLEENWAVKYLQGTDVYRLTNLKEDYIKLAMFILEERQNPDSFWKDYIAVLPQDWSNFPSLFSKHD